MRYALCFGKFHTKRKWKYDARLRCHRPKIEFIISFEQETDSNQKAGRWSRVYFKDFLDSTTLPSPPSLTVPSTPIPSRPLNYPSLSLEVGPLNPAKGSGERCKLPRAEFWCILALIWHLVTRVLMIFLRINWPNVILDSTFFSFGLHIFRFGLHILVGLHA